MGFWSTHRKAWCLLMVLGISRLCKLWQKSLVSMMRLICTLKVCLEAIRLRVMKELSFKLSQLI